LELSGILAYSPGNIDFKYGKVPEVVDPNDAMAPLGPGSVNCDCDNFIVNIASESDRLLNYNDFRFAKHVLARVTWKLLAMYR
jgi:hypothetical protein